MAVRFENFTIPCPVCDEKTARVGRKRDGMGRTWRTICPRGASVRAGVATSAGKNIAHHIALARPKPASSQSSSLSRSAARCRHCNPALGPAPADLSRASQS